MSKGILKFSLPEEQAEFEQAQAAGLYQSVIWQFTQWIRNEVKYGSREAIPAQEVKDKIWELIQDKDLGEHFL